ncbi:class I SAM-dependent methyltransferase [Flavonifractor sp. An100]|uniref:class I SAM-dependent methyltransferase n=1 Tax=Flavonifractor sp. An100 TaxID=1965538 RepID=UPI0013028A51|nr:class I SAM-dependent methyltransferase [Flavonifractor sp. An100]
MSEEKYHYRKLIDQETVNRGETSHAKLLQWIKPRTRVLECGCAYGIMTRYMKEVLGCYVVVLELDQEAFQEASAYADGGYCVNIEDDAWMIDLAAQSFDYILYADVLEHLRNPEAVLKKMRHFLKPDGSVLLSVPNVAHGDIIMNLLCDQFTYTPLGLLDNTHIHLFARKNLHDMVEAAGYHISEEDCTLVPLFSSEQGLYLPSGNKKALEDALDLHTTKNIYQFVCRLTQEHVKTVSKLENAITYQLSNEISSRLYYDNGSGFNEENRIDIQGILTDQHYVYHISLPAGCKQIRYDPIEAKKCIVKNISAHCGKDLLPITATNGIGFECSYFFVNEDPQILFLIQNQEACTITLTVELILLAATSWRSVEEFLQAQNNRWITTLTDKEIQLQAVNEAKADVEQSLKIVQNALTVKEDQLRAVNGAKADVEQSLKIVQNALNIKEDQLRAVNGAKADVEKNLHIVQDALTIKEDQLQAVNMAKLEAEQALDGLRKILSSRTVECEELKRNQQELETHLNLLQSDYSLLKNELSNVLTELNAIKNSRLWKLSQFLLFWRKK